MSIDLKTASVAPLRRTFDHLAARLGPDKSPTRYQESVWGLQPALNFHYRPTWQPEFELYDPRRTAIVMQDFDDLVDPRQYYYGTWTVQRGRQQDAQERNFEAVEKRRLLDGVAPEWRRRIAEVVVPVRHVAWAANNNNSYIAAYGFGAPLTSAASMHMMDQLGVAQYVTRIGLLLADNDPLALDRAKQAWLDAPHWQPLRALVEESMVTQDWFELFLLQNFLIDGALQPLVFEHFARVVVAHGGAVFPLLTEFMVDWFAESSRWVDAVLASAAGASPANAARLSGWLTAWLPRVQGALLPLAEVAFNSHGEARIDEVLAVLAQRAGAAGLAA